MEGFLCPICLCDLGRPDFLQIHFEQIHGGDKLGSDNGSDDNFKFRSIINFAKDKLLNSSILISTSPISSSHKNPEPIIPEPNRSLSIAEDTVLTRNRTNLFINSRSNRSYYRRSQHDQMIRKLEKLIDLLKRGDVYSRRNLRVMEKHVTEWAEDRDIYRCPDCAAPFNLSRRRHHCRFCGFIMCAKCSKFIDLAKANELLTSLSNPETVSINTESSIESSSSSHRSLTSSIVSSVHSIRPLFGASFEAVITDPGIRVCSTCEENLNEAVSYANKKLNGSSSNCPSISSSSSNSQSSQNSISLAFYNRVKLALALSSNDEDYTQTLNQLRNLVNELDNFITDQKKSNNQSVSKKERIILSNIRTYAVSSLREIVRTASSRPVSAEDSLSKHEREEIEEWSQLLQDQINRTYQRIDQARKAYKFDDVAMLEASLEQLKLDKNKLKARMCASSPSSSN